MALLEVKNLSFTYPRQPKDTTEPKPALSGVSLDIRRGEFMVLCGASGCGKSTLLRLLKRELAPEGEKSGEIIFCGKEQSTLSEREAACEIGYVLQNPENQIVTDKVWHELAFGLENMGVPTPVIRRRVAEMACFFGIDDWFRKKTTELSGGQKQLLNLASILSMQPKLLILDEPTSQLDPIAASDFIHTLSKINKELGLTILLTEHRLEEVFPLADRVAVMDQGKLLFVESPRQAGHELKKFDPNHRMLLGLPSAVRIYQGLDAEDVTCPLTVRDGRNFIEENYNNTITRLEREPEKKEEKDRPIAMRMKDICFRYEKEEPDVLDHVALTLYEGEVVSLLGGNGAGKTTLLSVISGTNRPYYGKIEVFGKRLQKYRGKELYIRKLASLPQNPQTVFLKMTVREDYEELAKVLGCKKSELKDKIQAVAQQLEITHLLERHPYDLSGGEQQRAAIGKVLLLEPRLLLLDEPTKGIDAWSKRQLGNLLKDLRGQGITVLMVTHDVEFAAEVSDRCGLFFDHEITSVDTPEEFFCNNNYYTTAANRISRQQYENAITCEEVIELCRQNGRKSIR
ncbi:ABC transporter ATP-binding protein [Blautia faecicola]|uniref:Energy-coupling factor ABC transporter ATP-binding protein n=1 Tax=Blautia faecicola TaxID=2509240 RepID=A0A4Q1REL7_9FIRM|nr:ABC transporter ATP-binding protein [Blautia faecicola]RXS73922.1 energy-coupling factor ABC transporter ATP-binding protein [Blautia faecicola]